MDIQKYINSAIEGLKAKAVVASSTKDKVLSRINETPSRINNAINSLKSNVDTKLQTNKLQMQKMLQQRRQEFDTAKINLSNTFNNRSDNSSKNMI